MSALTVFLSLLFFTTLGTAYVKGYDFVRSRKPGSLVTFYLIIATVRMLFTATVVAIYAYFSDDRECTVSFVTMFMGMYVLMMIVTLIMRH